MLCARRQDMLFARKDHDTQQAQYKGYEMASGSTPHFHNSAGVPAIEIGTKEFMCIGAKPPHDHPHIFIDMGDDQETVCPYCSTLYKYDPRLAAARIEAGGRLVVRRSGLITPKSHAPKPCALPTPF